MVVSKDWFMECNNNEITRKNSEKDLIKYVLEEPLYYQLIY